MAPHILEIPNEIIDLILDELDDSPESKFKLMSTCQQFRRCLLPRIYSACQLNFGRTKHIPTAFLCDRTAAGVWLLHKNYPEHGRLVESLSISFSTKFFIEGLVLDETDDFGMTRSPQYVLGKLLPQFDTLRRVRLDYVNHYRNIPYDLGGFVDTLCMVLSRRSLKEVSINLVFRTEDKRTWGVEEQKLDASNGWTSPYPPMANLDKLDISFQEKECPYQLQDLSDTAFAWLIGVFLRLFELPCQSLKCLKFKYRADRHRSPDLRHCPLNLLDPHPEPDRIMNRPGGQLRLPNLETLTISVSDAGRWAFEQYFDIDFENIKSLLLFGIYDNITQNDLNFLRKFTSLSVLHLQYPARKYFGNWIESAVSLRESCQTLRKVVIYGQGSPSTNASQLEEFLRKYGKFYNACIEEKEVPAHMTDQGVKPDDYTLYLYLPFVV
ncbi:hypothetical protein TWF506_003379 [Arthrobotrys conoides]|uniref:F-box domain-containing protein n=1 Tax=Arthrobotrys conoides TaxID=74498 RepID=A0AAN8P529_9PEZI